MPRLRLILLLTLALNWTQAQSIQAIAQELDQHIRIFSDLGPWDDTRVFDSLPLLSRRLLAGFEKGDSVDSFTLIELHGWMMDSLLGQLFQHPEMPQYLPDQLIHSVAPLKSRDNRWFQYCFDARTGGSYRSSNCFFYYVDGDRPRLGKSNSLSGEDSGDWTSDGYYRVIDFPADSLGRPRYFLLSAVRGCNTCISETAELVRYNGEGRFSNEFAYAVSDRGFGGIMDLSLNQDTVLTIAYGRSDMNEGCGLGEGFDESHPQVQAYQAEYGYYPEFCRYSYLWQAGAFRLTKEEHFYGDEALAESRKHHE